MTERERREAIERFNAIGEEFRTIADTLERENRAAGEAERQRMDRLRAEQDRLSARLRGGDAIRMAAPSGAERLEAAERAIRANVAAGRPTTVVLTRADGTSGSGSTTPATPASTLTDISVANDGSLVSIRLQDIVKPLCEGLILDKVGLPLMTGLVGEYVWPVVGMVDAEIGGDALELTEKKISVSALKAVPDTIGITVGVTRRTINQTDGIIENIVKEILPLAISNALNKAMFGTTKATGATNLVGPFVGKTPEEITMTFKDINLLKAKIYAAGVEGEHMAMVMTKATKALLEATPKDAGSGIMICENDMIAGIPVFTTNAIGEGYIGIGDFTYQPVGQFGDFSFIVNPYSESRKDVVEFTMHVDFGTKTLRSDAFILGKIKEPAESEASGSDT